METELLAHLEACANAFAAARGLKISTVARLATQDGQFFSRLRDPKNTFTVRKYDTVIRWFSDNWPDGAMWPADVPRPSDRRPV